MSKYHINAKGEQGISKAENDAQLDRSTAHSLAEMLRRPRYEVISVPGTADEVDQHLSREITITVTVEPRRGLDAALELSEDLTARGFGVVPHLAARLVRDARHAQEILDRLDEGGITEIFVIGGDADPPVGDYSDATQLLSVIGGERTVGVAAYPEGHPLISDAELDRALMGKRSQCSYVATQMCFDPATVGRWIERARALGFDRPVHVGVPGPVDTLRLAKVATRIGVGPSLRYARKQRGSARLLRPGGYRPDQLLADLVRHPIAGLHIYTLGDIATTERWRRVTLERLTDA